MAMARGMDDGSGLSRRGLLGLGAAGAAGLVLGGCQTGSGGRAEGGSSGRRRVRIAHLTDTHIQTELRGNEGVAACLEHIRGQQGVDLIVHTGDIVFDAFDQEIGRTRSLWDLWQKTFADGWNGRVRYCLGNHDIWGWNKEKSGTSGGEPGWGKKLAIDTLGVPGAVRDGCYYSFDEGGGGWGGGGGGGGWHIVILDSVRPSGNGYYGGLDDEQYEWLQADLAAHRQKPTLIVSHISIFTATVLDVEAKERKRQVSSAVMFDDWPRVKKLFLENPQVRLCISGHMHLIDRVEYNGVTYCCNGAASGAWWKGANKECREGYTLVDLYSDGTFENRYVEYGWRA
jgi:predicted phosphodiesterase